MRRKIAGVIALTALGLAGCGTAGHVTAHGHIPAVVTPATAGDVILCNAQPGDHPDTDTARVDTSSDGHTVDVFCADPARDTGTWGGLTVGAYLHCTDDWEADGRDAGEDADLPGGGWWVHCA